MSYYRRGFETYKELQREQGWWGEELGKEEIELLRDIEREEEFWRPRGRRARRVA